MPKKVWSDYTLIETFYKRVSQHGVVADVQYSRFACPYNCNKFVELPTASVSNNKSTECRHHLLSCCGVASDGRKAVDDTRIADARTPVVGTAVSSGESIVVETLKANHAEQMKAQKELMKAQKEQHEELMRALTGRLDRKNAQLSATFAAGNLTPPNSDDSEDETAIKIANLDEMARLKEAEYATGRVGASPPRDGEDAHTATTRCLKRCAEEVGSRPYGRCPAIKMHSKPVRHLQTPSPLSSRLPALPTPDLPARQMQPFDIVLVDEPKVRLRAEACVHTQRLLTSPLLRPGECALHTTHPLSRRDERSVGTGAQPCTLFRLQSGCDGD